jgi:hypothetical protein
VQVEKSNGAVTLRFDDEETARRLAGLDGDDLIRAIVDLLGGRSPVSDEERIGRSDGGPNPSAAATRLR